MESRTEVILYKLETHQFPGNENDSWGIGILVTKDIDTKIFDIHRSLKKTMKKVLKLSEEQQLILNYKKGTWSLNLEFINDDNVNNKYSMVAKINKKEVRILLTRLMQELKYTILMAILYKKQFQ